MIHMRLKYMVLMIVVILMMASCAPIEGIDGEEDNLPNIGDGKADVVDETEIVEEDPIVVPEEEPEVIPEPEPIEVNFVKIKADALNVRRNGNMDADVLTKIYENQIYKVLDTNEDLAGLLWYKLEAPDDITGWVSSEYCIGGKTYEELVD